MSEPPRDFKQGVDAKRVEARHWRAVAGAAAKKAGGGAVVGAQRRAKVDVGKLMFKPSRKFQPKVAGASIWHE
eukprot:11210100-Lingulodinium_polyedra.AAC.1